MTLEQMGRAIIENLPKKTGRTLGQWVELVRAEGSVLRKERIEWHKCMHGLGHVQAQIVAGETDKPVDYASSTPCEPI